MLAILLTVVLRATYNVRVLDGGGPRLVVSDGTRMRTFWTTRKARAVMGRRWAAAHEAELRALDALRARDRAVVEMEAERRRRREDRAADSAALVAALHAIAGVSAEVDDARAAYADQGDLTQVLFGGKGQ